MMVSSFPSFSQDKELREVERLVKNEKYTEGYTALQNLFPIIEQFSDEQKVWFYYLQSKIHSESAVESDENKNFTTIVNAFEQIEKLEKNNKVTRFVKTTANAKNRLLSKIVNAAIDDTTNQDWEKASQNYFNAYQLSKTDTLFLYHAANQALKADDKKTAIKHYKDLVKLNYKGKTTLYTAVNRSNGTVVSFGNDQRRRDQQVRNLLYDQPEEIVLESYQPIIYKNLALLLVNQNNYSEGEQYLIKAFELNPNDYDLLISLFYVYMDTNRRFRFEDYMRQGVKKFVENPSLYYNIGAVYFNLGIKDKAKEYFEKTLQLDKNNYHANHALGNLLLEKDKDISTQINNLSNNKADRQKKQQLLNEKAENYKQIIVYFEKALLNSKEDTKELKQLIKDIKELI